MVSKSAPAALALAFAPAPHAQPAHPPHWNYAGPAGPAAWGALDPVFAGRAVEES